jgi:hypothetical protein
MLPEYDSVKVFMYTRGFVVSLLDLPIMNGPVGRGPLVSDLGKLLEGSEENYEHLMIALVVLMPLPWAYSKPECTTQTALPNPGTV